MVIPTIVNFALAVFFLWYFGRKPMAAFLSARSEKVRREIKEAKVLAKEAEEDLGLWRTNFSRIKEHSDEQFLQAHRAMEKQASLASLATQAEVERLEKEAASIAQQEREKIQDELVREFVDKSVGMAKQALTRNFGEKNRAALLSETVELLKHG